MLDTGLVAQASSVARRPRLKKRPHNLHRCSGVEELVRELRAREIDPVSLVHEFIKPSYDVGILATGSIAWGIATESSDLDIWALVPSADAFKGKRPREIGGSAVTYLPIDRPDRAEMALFLSGIEVDLSFVINPAVERHAQSGVRDAPLKSDVHAPDKSFVTRLATGWPLHGPDVVRRWRSYYETDNLRMRWMADDFTLAAKNLEDMEAGIGLSKGHVPAIGVYCATRLLRSLLAYNGCYSTSVKWMLRIGRLIDTADPGMRAVLIEGRELAFPTLLQSAEDERAYFQRVYEYCGTVKGILSREEGMADILDSVIHDLDIILCSSPADLGS